MKRKKIKIYKRFNKKANVVLFNGDTKDLIKKIPKKSIQLIITSPPYNIGKEYEKRKELKNYFREQSEIIKMCISLLKPKGSICWQVGNYISSKGEVFPLDIFLYEIFKSNGLILRNRVIWQFGHGLHSRRRFSGRHEAILWFTKDIKDYYFNLEEVRIPQIYPGKRAFKGPNKGKYSSHPNGKNPSDVWEIPNVKNNHIEKTDHPCQFPIGLVQRLIRGLSKKGDWIFDPFMGSGSTACAAIIEGRKAVGAEIIEKYYRIALDRIQHAWNGTLGYRPYDKPIYKPKIGSKLTVRRDTDEDSTLFQFE